MEPYEFECKWIDKNDLWKTADEIRSRYWPEGTLPVDMEKIVELRLKLDIEQNIIFFPQSTWTYNFPLLRKIFTINGHCQTC